MHTRVRAAAVPPLHRVMRAIAAFLFLIGLFRRLAPTAIGRDLGLQFGATLGLPAATVFVRTER